jgi:uncharacterized sulfatase
MKRHAMTLSPFNRTGLANIRHPAHPVSLSKRRLRTCVGLLLTALSLTAFAADTSARPNVLFIIVDDLTTTLSCYGDRDARTPHMDALAARGVRFDRAYTQFSLCNPTRAAFLTGCYPERTQVYDLTASFRKALPDAVTLPQLFKNAGYSAGRVGKVFHVSDDAWTKLDAQIGAPLAKDQTILDEAKLAQASEGDLSDPPHEIKRTKKNGRGQESEETTKDYNCCYAPSKRPASDFTDYQIADEAIATLESFRDKPFFLAVGFIRPHTPYVAPQAFFDLLDPLKLAMPAFYQPGGESLAEIPNAALRPNNNVFKYQAPSAKESREARRAYLATTAFADSQVGRLLAKLAELKLDTNTIVVLTGDHGYQLGEHGLWAKQTLFEEGTHVPLIVAGPGVKPGVCAGLVEQIDIYPTLAGLAGLPSPRQVQGRTLQPLLADPSSPGKTAVFSTMVSTHTKLVGHSIRTERYRYIEWDEGRGGRQLYDHASDPHELNNLAGQPAQAPLAADLKSQLSNHLKESANQ